MPGGSHWTCHPSRPRTLTCLYTAPLQAGTATQFTVRTFITAHPGTLLTTTATVYPSDSTPADNHASDQIRVQRFR